MFDNIGGKIKDLTKVFCIIGIVACVILGFVLMCIEQVLLGFIVIFVGSVVCYLGSFFAYGFGQLIQNSDILISELKNKPDNSDDSQKSVPSASPSLGTSDIKPIVRNITIQNREIPVSVIKEDADWIKCPVCGIKQKDKNSKCRNCGQKFMND